MSECYHLAEFFKAKNFTINQSKWDNRIKEAQKWRNYIRSRYKDGRKKYPEVKKIYKTIPIASGHLAEDLIRKFRLDMQVLSLAEPCCPLC